MRESAVVLVDQRWSYGEEMTGERRSYLCVWNSKFQTWCLPGGKIDPGETPGDAARRELFEETGLVAKTGLSFIYKDVSIGPEDFKVYMFHCDYTEPCASDRNIKCELGSTHRWMPLDRLAEVSRFGAFYTNASRNGHWATLIRA